MPRRLALIAIVFFLVAGNSFGSDGTEIIGIWDNEDNRAKIEIFHCGERYCGKIVWLRQPLYPTGEKEGMEGKPRADLENPDPELRSRPLLGLQIMQGFAYSGNDTWDEGRIYDPESGKTYRGKITLVSPHRLELRGYVGIPLFGRSSVWTR